MDIHAHIPNNLDAKNMHFDGLIIEKTSSLGKYNHDIPLPLIQRNEIKNNNNNKILKIRRKKSNISKNP